MREPTFSPESRELRDPFLGVSLVIISIQTTAESKNATLGSRSSILFAANCPVVSGFKFSGLPA
jgi:hypothetical protein